jgi:hypothetical protein
VPESVDPLDLHRDPAPECPDPGHLARLVLHGTCPAVARSSTNGSLARITLPSLPPRARLI